MKLYILVNIIFDHYPWLLDLGKIYVKIYS